MAAEQPAMLVAPTCVIRCESERREQGEDWMGLELSSAEQTVLAARGEANPKKVHLHQLAFCSAFLRS
jgi:predicted component of type VI protein secretion system